MIQHKNNPNGFKTISECPCSVCGRKILPIYDNFCVECLASNDWKNFNSELAERFETNNKIEKEHTLFSFDGIENAITIKR